MANRRTPAANRIRGPQSALTDFLASHNISAAEISRGHQRRIQDAQAQAGTAANQEEDNENDSSTGDGEDVAERKKRKRKEEKSILKIKQSKEFKRRKWEKKRNNSETEDDDVLARSMLQKAQPLPGQFDNCEICEKRFTVTTYSKTGPDGGLLCGKCSKELADEEKKMQPKKKRAPAKGKGRRQTESDRMMGDVKPGAKSLLECCVVRVADVVHDIEEFGDMPQNLLDRLSQILSQKRAITPRTLHLFLRPDLDKIAIYDAAKLDEEDFIKIFSFMPNLEHINLRNAGQMKDDALMYLIDKNRRVKHLQLGATNLISDKAWISLFKTVGPQLHSFKASELNDALDDTTVAVMSTSSTNLKRLKLRKCSHMTETSLMAISQLPSLEHLSLAVGQDSSPETLISLIKAVGPSLMTLSLEDYTEADDSVLATIHSSCRKLTKLRFTGSNACSDRAFAELFTGWTNPPTAFVDFSDNRSVDNANPGGPEDDPIGFGSEAFKALMTHSGSSLERLNLHSCRHISHQALSTIFDGKKRYPVLRDIDLSFVTVVDDVIVTGIFRSCPALAKLAVFACFQAREVRIPVGIAVIGLPNAKDNIVMEGDVLDQF